MRNLIKQLKMYSITVLDRLITLLRLNRQWLDEVVRPQQEIYIQTYSTKKMMCVTCSVNNVVLFHLYFPILLFIFILL